MTAQGLDAEIASWQFIEIGTLKELSLELVANSEGGITILVAPILQHVPAELETIFSNFIVCEGHERVLASGASRQRIWLSDDAERAMPSRIGLFDESENSLVVSIIGGGYDGETYGPALLQVLFSQIVEHFFLAVPVLVLDQARKIHNSQLRSVRPLYFDTKDVPCKCRSVFVIVVGVISDSHACFTLFNDSTKLSSELRKVGYRLAETSNTLLVTRRPLRIGQNLDTDVLRSGTAQYDFRCKERACIVRTRKIDLGQRFDDTTLT